MNNRNFLYDILRDKGSTKYSITKVLALIFSIFLIGYLSYYAFWLNVIVDHTLIVEIIGLIAGLVGLKNNWGVKSKSPKTIDTTDVTIIDSQNTSEENIEEGLF